MESLTPLMAELRREWVRLGAVTSLDGIPIDAWWTGPCSALTISADRARDSEAGGGGAGRFFIEWVGLTAPMLEWAGLICPCTRVIG